MRDQVQEMERILPSIISRWPSESAFRSSFLGLLASHGSVAMVRLIFRDQIPEERTYSRYDTSFMSHAVRSHNIPVVDWAFNKGGITVMGLPKTSFLSEIAASDSLETFNIWRNVVLSSGYFQLLMSNIVECRKWSPLMESQVASLWIEQHQLGNFPTSLASRLLKILASSSCSLVLAQALVACGADINYRSNKNSAELPPLHCAIRKTSTEAADLVKYLLLSGADPHVKIIRSSGKNKGQEIVPSLEPGAKGISKWLGQTWDELVAWAAEERRKISEDTFPSASSTLSADRG